MTRDELRRENADIRDSIKFVLEKHRELQAATDDFPSDKACMSRWELQSSSTATPICNKGSRRTSIPNALRVHPAEAGEEDKTGTRGTYCAVADWISTGPTAEATMNGLIYLVGLVVVIMFILSFLGLR